MSKSNNLQLIYDIAGGHQFQTIDMNLPLFAVDQRKYQGWESYLKGYLVIIQGLYSCHTYN